MLSEENSIVRVVARTIAKPDEIIQVKMILVTLMANTRLENGCLRYDVWQNQGDPTDFTILEEWSTQSFLDAHFQTIHFQTAIDQLDGLLQSASDIRCYQEII